MGSLGSECNGVAKPIEIKQNGVKKPIESERDGLSKRSIPFMVLSSGKEDSMTAPPPPISQTLPSSERAKQRFNVHGNAIITGGAGALGLAAARALLEHGVSGLAIFDLNPAQSQAAIDDLRFDFPSAIIETRAVNVSDHVAVHDAVSGTAHSLGSVDHLFCFVGVVGCVSAIDTSAAQWRQILDINTTGSFFCAQAAAKQMIAQGTGGSITFTASISAHRVNYPQPQAAYNVSKSAILMLKNCLAAEWAHYGIRVNSLSPGYMDTILNEGDGIAEARKIWGERNPSGRMGVPSELTGAVVLLSSECGSYINGTDIVVDGGAIVF